MGSSKWIIRRKCCVMFFALFLLLGLKSACYLDYYLGRNTCGMKKSFVDHIIFYWSVKSTFLPFNLHNYNNGWVPSTSSYFTMRFILFSYVYVSNQNNNININPFLSEKFSFNANEYVHWLRLGNNECKYCSRI